MHFKRTFQSLWHTYLMRRRARAATAAMLAEADTLFARAYLFEAMRRFNTAVEELALDEHEEETRH
jgi:hypothetical protein